MHITRNKKVLLVLLGLFVSTISYSQEAATQASFLDKNMNDIVTILLITVLVVFFLAILMISNSLIKMGANDLPEDRRAKYGDFSLIPGVNLSGMYQKLTDAVPIVEENDIMLDHDYDGIHELDNHLPPWWKYGFYFTIIWAVGVLGYKYVLGQGLSIHEKYEKTVELAEVQKAEYLSKMGSSIDETNVTLLSDASALKSGEENYMMLCKACHGEFGEGTIGPNLTDEYWMHGGDVKDLFKTVKYGVPNKGMIAWQDQLLPNQMAEVVSFILTLQGTNPENGKEPQGELHGSGKSTDNADESDVDETSDEDSNVDETKSELLTDAASIKNGEETYMTLCKVCHGEFGQGTIGPNFADEYWVHGGSMSDIIKIIKEGAPSKGMIAWEDQLSPEQIAEVASYILTFQGTDPENAKHAEGELYVP